MQGKLRQWLADEPRALNAAYTLMLAGTFLFDFLMDTQEAAGGSVGP